MDFANRFDPFPPGKVVLKPYVDMFASPSHPPQTGIGSRYEFQGVASIGRLVTGRAKALVSPTGLDGFCNAHIGWKIPFQGIVKAA